MQKELFCSFHGNFAEFLEVLHKGKSDLTGTGASGFVTLYYLSLCVLCILCELGIDFFNKLFHNCFGLVMEFSKV